LSEHWEQTASTLWPCKETWRCSCTIWRTSPSPGISGFKTRHYLWYYRQRWSWLWFFRHSHVYCHYSTIAAIKCQI